MEHDSEHVCREDDETTRIVEEAAHWVVNLDETDEEECAAFVRWLRTSQRHVEEFLQLSLIGQDLEESGTAPDSNQALPRGVIPSEQAELWRAEHTFATLLAALAKEGRPERAMYARYRLPILRVFLHRGIELTVAQGLMQHVFVRALQEVHVEGDADADYLSECLYHLSCDLARSHTQRRLRQSLSVPDDVIGLSEEALSLEERLDEQLLSRSVKDLLRHQADAREREILTRFYLLEESRSAICNSLQLTAYQFNQTLYRARQRFADILRRRGFSLPDPGANCLKKTYQAAQYVADDLDLPHKQKFEMQMIQNSCCNHEVDVWSTIKRFMPKPRARKSVSG